MVKNVYQWFPTTKIASQNVLFCRQHKDIYFTVIEEERNKVFIFKLDSENFDYF